MAVAHVNPKNEPCPFSPTDTYDLEALTTIVTEPKLWDIGVDEPAESDAPTATPAPSGPVAEFLAKRSRLESREPGAVTNAATTNVETPAPPPAPAKPAAQGRKKKAQRGKPEDVDDWDPRT